MEKLEIKGRAPREGEIVFITSSILMVEDFVNSGMARLDMYLIENNISYTEFQSALGRVERRAPELYKAYQKYVKDQEEHLITMVKETYPIIKAGIQNKVKTAYGETRDFDLLDFYAITNGLLAPRDYFGILKKTKYKNDVRDFMQFLKSCGMGVKYHRTMSKKAIEDYVNMYTEVECAQDGRGFPILGTGVEITEEDKIALFCFLDDNHCPTTQQTLRLATKRLVRYGLDSIVEQKDIDGKSLVKK